MKRLKREMQILRVELRHEELKLKCEEKETIMKGPDNTKVQTRMKINLVGMRKKSQRRYKKSNSEK